MYFVYIIIQVNRSVVQNLVATFFLWRATKDTSNDFFGCYWRLYWCFGDSWKRLSSSTSSGVLPRASPSQSSQLLQSEQRGDPLSPRMNRACAKAPDPALRIQISFKCFASHILTLSSLFVPLWQTGNQTPSSNVVWNRLLGVIPGIPTMDEKGHCLFVIF